jgi:hypothetical protein
MRQISDLSSSQLRSLSTICRVVSLAVSGEPHLEGRQRGDNDTNPYVDRHGILIFEAQQPWRCDKPQSGPMIDAVCRGAPADKLNSQGEKNRIVPKERFTMSQSLTLDHSSMTPSSVRSRAGILEAKL